MSDKTYKIDLLPMDFNKSAMQALEDEINRQYAEGWEFVAFVKPRTGGIMQIEVECIVYRRIGAIQPSVEGDNAHR